MLLDCILSEDAFIIINGNQNMVKGNFIANCTCALVLGEGSRDNIIVENTILNCQGGSMSSTTISERNSYNNLIYHNNFINCRWYWALQTGVNNTWFDNRTLEGNYWSNVWGTDADGDGILDEWVEFGVYERDYYPLKNPYWRPADINHDLEVDIIDLVKIGASFGSVPSDPSWNPHTDIAQPYDCIDILDVVLCASHFGEKH